MSASLLSSLDQLITKRNTSRGSPFHVIKQPKLKHHWLLFHLSHLLALPYCLTYPSTKIRATRIFDFLGSTTKQTLISQLFNCLRTLISSNYQQASLLKQLFIISYCIFNSLRGSASTLRQLLVDL